MGDFTPEAAAVELGCKVSWLKTNIHRFDHQQYGRERWALTPAQLDQIRAACSVRGADAPPPTVAAQKVSDLKPTPRRRRA